MADLFWLSDEQWAVVGRFYDPAPPRVPSTTGRPRKAGQRLATLAKVAADAATVWQALHVENWYGGAARDLQLASATAVWRHYGLPSFTSSRRARGTACLSWLISRAWRA